MKSKKNITILISFFICLFLYLYSKTLPIPVANTSLFQGNEFRIAHRCGKSILPENTLYACKEIYNNNLADILEMDVHLTKDSHLVVIHDATVDRTTNGKVSDFTYDEIRNLDAGYNFTIDTKTFPYRNKGIQILELEEFLKALPYANYYIELKVKDLLAAEILVKLIEKNNMQKKVFIGSVSDSVNEKIRELSQGKISVFSGIKQTTKWYLAYLLGIRGAVDPPEVMAIPDLPRILPISDKFVRATKEQGIKVHIFTVNEKEKIIQFHLLGIDGVMTDNPYLFKIE